MTIVVGLMAIAGYFLLPGEAAKDVAYSAIGLGSVACVVAGSRRQPPQRRRGWFAVAAGNLSFVLGDGVYDVYKFVLHSPTPFPSVADAFYLLGYPFLIYGVATLVRGRQNGVAREGYADAAIVSIGGLALSWTFLMGPYAEDRTLGVFGKLVTLGYPVLDLGVLFIVVRGLMFTRSRHTAHTLLAVAMCSMIVADFLYDLLALHGVYSVGSPLDAGWLINYVLVGAAALHPATVTGPPGGATEGQLSEGLEEGDASRRRLPVVALAGFISPVILFVTTMVGARSDVAALAITSVLLFSLVMLRMYWMFQRIAAQTRSLEDSFSVRDLLESELRHRAFHDSLTGLANRALLHDRVEHALAAAPRSRGATAVCFCDLDGFKTINDSLGHHVGDAMLIAAGKRLTTVVRPGDTVARLGGDEFAVLMEDVEDPAAAAAVAERMVAVLRQPVEVEGRQISMSASAGLAIADLTTTTEELLSKADSAMYAAKASGKNRFEVFEHAMHARVVHRLELSNSFDQALERNEFFLEYQPQFSLHDGHLQGFEALVRWQHPTLGLVVPDRFIRLAEETGHIVPIGRWVLEQACRQAVAWSGDGGSTLNMSVNLSARQLLDPHLLDDVRTVVALSGLDPHRLTLEITESMLMVDVDRSVALLTELKQLGIRLAIDDFGTGYSSLNHLRRFPVDELKIDKSFVDPLTNPNGEGAAFIQTIVGLARSLGLLTVAEGIEEEGQRRALTQMGCDSAQGFLLGRPLDSSAATDLVVTRVAG